MKIAATVQDLAAYDQIAALDAAIAALKKDRDALAAPIRERMESEGIDSITLHDKALFTLTTATRESLDKDAMEAEYPGLLAQFTKKVIGPRFIVQRVKRAAIAA
jgi:hypothetical protein